MNYDLVAKVWDDDRRIERAKNIAAEMICHISSGFKVAMEFGCGTGLISFFLLDHFRDITLIDSSQGMIDVLTEKIRKTNVKNMFPLMLDLNKEKYSDKKFDVIYSSMAYHHIVDTNKITTKLFDMINKGGSVCIVDLDKDDGSFHLNEPLFDGHNGFEKDALCEIFSEAGFVNISFNTFYNNVKEVFDKKIPYSLFCLYAEKPI